MGLCSDPPSRGWWIQGNSMVLRAHTTHLNLLVQSLDSETALKLSGENPDYGIQALFEAIENKRYPSWTVYVVRSYHLSLQSRNSMTCHSKR